MATTAEPELPIPQTNRLNPVWCLVISVVRVKISTRTRKRKTEDPDAVGSGLRRRHERSGQLRMVRCRCEKAPACARTARRVLPVKDIAAMSFMAVTRRSGFRSTCRKNWCQRCRAAIENGRRLKELISEAGLRYTQALKDERKRRDQKSEERTAMLDDSEVLAWYARHGCSERAQAVINHIRSFRARASRWRRQAQRRPGGIPRGRWVSRFSLRAIELNWQRSTNWSTIRRCLSTTISRQRSSLTTKAPAGGSLGVLHTADFFVIRKSGAGWEECKTQDELVHLSRRNENRYRSDDGASLALPAWRVVCRRPRALLPRPILARYRLGVSAERPVHGGLFPRRPGRCRPASAMS